MPIRSFLIVSLLLIGFSSYADELQSRNELPMQVTGLFSSGKFDELEKMANQFREEEARTTGGTWKLDLFYAGFRLLATPVNGHTSLSGNINFTKRWLVKFPTSPTPRVVHAIFLYEEAWAIRGDVYANELDDAKLRSFHEHVKLARDQLAEDENIASVDPYWHELVLQVAMCENVGKAKFMALLDRAVSKFPNFYELYFVAIQNFSQKWNGNSAEVDRIASYAVRHTKRTEGEGLYARAYWYASQVQYGSKLFKLSKVSWPRMKQGIHDALSKYPDPWNINSFAYFSCLAGDRRETAILIKQIKQPIINAWNDEMNVFAQCNAWSSESRKANKS